MEVLYLFLVSIFAGAFGAMLGLGGGVILVPALTLLFNQPMNGAVAASLVSIVATSCVGVQTYLRSGWADVRLGVELLIPMALGAIAGVWLGIFIPPKWIAALFIILIFYILYQMMTATANQFDTEEPPQEAAIVPIQKRAAVSVLSLLAGIISALLGVGGGLIQVPMMNGLIRTPFKMAIGTSSFLIGITASVSALIYFARGVLQPDLVVPCTLGIFVGARLGSKFGVRAPAFLLRGLFAVVMIVTAVRMYWRWFL